MRGQNQHFYLYGAGINAYGVIKFLGKENILGIIDSAEERWGKSIEGVGIHPLDWYLEQPEHENCPVVISAFQKRDEVVAFLDSRGVKNYLDALYMQAGMLPVAELTDFLLSVQEASGRRLAFDDTTLLSFLVAQNISARGKSAVVVGFLSASNEWAREQSGLPVIPHEEREKFLLVLTDSASAEKDDEPSVPFVNLVEHIYFNQKFFQPRLARFRNIHRGRRCFVIGNGPSLRIEDLDALHKNGEVCFASNAIHLAFKKTDWRPTYYATFDFLAFVNIYPAVQNSGMRAIFIEDYYNYIGLPLPPEVNAVHRVHMRHKTGFASDVSQFAYSGCTVTYTLMQLAAYMGFSEIYLLGVDFTFNLTANHFAKEYDTLSKPNSFQNAQDITLSAYQTAEDYSRTHGFRIYNATRGGELEVFERVDFDTVIQNTWGGVRKYSVIRTPVRYVASRKEVA